MSTMPKTNLFHFEFQPDSDQNSSAKGWGEGSLSINNLPFWFSGTRESPNPISWTWIDFLEHVAGIWNSLVLEQSYPLPWLQNMANPLATIWEVADNRWEGMRDEELIDQEFIIISKFVERHNLAAGWIGMATPALLWLRSGNSVWLYPEGMPVVRASFVTCIGELRRICDLIADSFSHSTNERVSSAVQAWRNTCYLAPDDVLANQGQGLFVFLKQVQGRADTSTFWDLSARTDIRTAANEGCILAAARMAAPVVQDASIIRSIIERIRNIPRIDSGKVDRASTEAARFLHKKNFYFAYANGYALAEWARDEWLAVPTSRIDIEGVLNSLFVRIKNVAFGTKSIEAIAVWGDHGPCILLNTDHAYISHPHRRRMTLAHELCHLLIDRSGALPVVEVLGGSADHFIEQRANAFAAELLLPRSQIERMWLKNLTFADLIIEITHEFDVSKSVAYAQVLNSTIFSKLSIDHQRNIQRNIRARIGQLYQTPYDDKVTSWIV